MAQGRASGRLVAVDILDRVVRAVEVNCTTAGVEVTGLGTGTLSAPLADLPPAEAGRVVSEVLREARIGARQAVVTIPRHQAVLKPLSAPPMPREELLSAILLQAERELPFPVAEARVDCIPTGLTVPGEPTAAGEVQRGVGVLLGAVQRGVVEGLRAPLEAAGLTVRRLGLRPCAAANALAFAGAETAGQFVAVVDIGDTLSEIAIVRDQHLVFARSVSTGASPDLKQAAAGEEAPTEDAPVGEAALGAGKGLSFFDEWQDALVLDVRRSLEAFAVQPGAAAVSAVYLTGVGAGDEGLAAAIAEAVGTRVAVLDPFERVAVSGRAERTPKPDRVAFSTALGAALGECQDLVPGFDFSVPLAERLRKPRRRWPYLTAAAVGVVVAAAIVVPVVLFGAQRAKLGRLEDQIAEVKKRVQAVKKIDEQIRDLAPWTDPAERVSWYRVFLSLSAIWPDNRRAYLRSLQFLKGNRISVSGQAQNAAVVEELLAALTKSPDFGVPEFSVITPGPDPFGYNMRFQFTVVWTGAGRDEGLQSVTGASPMAGAAQAAPAETASSAGATTREAS